MKLVGVMSPFDTLWFTERHYYWGWSLDMKCRHCVAAIMPAFVEWNNVEVLALPQLMRYYISWPCSTGWPSWSLCGFYWERSPLSPFTIQASAQGAWLILACFGYP